MAYRMDWLVPAKPGLLGQWLMQKRMAASKEFQALPQEAKDKWWIEFVERQTREREELEFIESGLS